MTRRVALISEHASPLTALGGVDSGGQNVYVGQLANHLAGIGYDVDIFTRRDSELLPETADWKRGVRIVHVPAGPPSYVRKEDMLALMPDFLGWIVKFFKSQRRPYDIVHANFFMSGLVAADLKKTLGVPFVVTFHALGRVRRLHQGEGDDFPDERFAIEDRIVEEADCVIAECPQDEEDLIRLYNADPNRITSIPCGFDPAELSPISKPLARVVLGLPPDDPVIVHVGRIVARKGVDNVIRGLARLRTRHGISPRLIIVGGDLQDGDPRIRAEVQRLNDIADEEQVNDIVTFAGRRGRDSLGCFYSAADIFITTPWYEPFGITPVEAMACGTPVIGANVGGIKFTVRDAETGYLVQPNNPDALAERIAHLYTNPKLLKLFGRQAIHRATHLFTWQRVANEIADLYERLICARDPKRRREADEGAIIISALDEARDTIQKARNRLTHAIIEAAEEIDRCFTNGGKLLICGNGGSAADSQHFAAELMGRFRAPDRPPLPAVALSADSAVLTAWSNDVAFEGVYTRQIEALAKSGDVLIAISTSGGSHNTCNALDAASRCGIRSIALLGGDGGDMRRQADVSIIVPSADTQRVQEMHTLVIHLVCELVERRLLSRLQWQSSMPEMVVSPVRRNGRRIAVALPQTALAQQGSRNGTKAQR
ncbi:MAG: glycosyltransferase [Chloroflexi bacterium]|nr:MAG: glycosyltransferase [Chloroflexota bacterium]